MLSKVFAFPRRKEQIDTAEGAVVAWELGSQTVQILEDRERISKMLSLDAVVSIFFLSSFFPFC